MSMKRRKNETTKKDLPSPFTQEVTGSPSPKGKSKKTKAVEKNVQKGKNLSKKVAFKSNKVQVITDDESVAAPKVTPSIASTSKANQNEGSDNQTMNQETVDWPQKDMSQLINRIEAALPEKDNLAYSTRAEKINWDNIAFDEYTGEECKKTWFLIQKRVRRFRILQEVLQDAKAWILKPWTNFYRGNKTKRHPDMPRRPLSIYMLFYLKKKDKFLNENPGMEMTEVSKKIAQLYKEIPASKREKYIRLAAEKRELYEEKLEAFYRLHPEIPRTSEKNSHAKVVEMGPQKPTTPFNIYCDAQYKKLQTDGDFDRNTFKERCKVQWNTMSDKKKLVYIDGALEREVKYHEELKNYISQHPNFVPVPLKPILTKEQRLMKEKMAGKPTKPPNSAYSLFSRRVLQSEDIKKVPPKDRMNVIANQWKNCTEDEKKEYRDRANHMMEQYKLDFASYLESLPEHKRIEELQNNLPKRKAKPSAENGEPSRKKQKIIPVSEEEVSHGETSSKDLYVGEPLHPPTSAYELFCRTASIPTRAAWQAQSASEKKKFEKQLKILKQDYIEQFEIFLKTLTKEQLTKFSALKNNDTKKSQVQESEESENSSSDSSSNDSDTSESS